MKKRTQMYSGPGKDWICSLTLLMFACCLIVSLEQEASHPPSQQLAPCIVHGMQIQKSVSTRQHGSSRHGEAGHAPHQPLQQAHAP